MKRIVALVLLIIACSARAQISGLAVPGMAIYDSLIPPLMAQYNMPGCAVAVVEDGSLVFVRGYGYADSSTQSIVQPYSRFRVASLSKAITATGILKLVEQGKLSLDDKIFTILNQYTPFDTTNVDKRTYDITVRECLQHTGGWDRNLSGDPMFEARQIAAKTNSPSPADQTTIIRYMMGQPLNYAPGTTYAYSNYGYLLLGRVIEKITGTNYADFIKSLMVKAGISRMVQGRSLLDEAQADEVHYYDYPGDGLATNVFTGAAGSVPWPYGGFYLEDHDANGGWVMSVIDYLRFVTAIDNRPSRPDILSSATIDTMESQPFPPVNNPGDVVWYGMGLDVRRVNSGDTNVWHFGSLPGTVTEEVRESSQGKFSWAAFFNSRPQDENTFDNALDQTLWQAHQGVTSTPAYDLFRPQPQIPVERSTVPYSPSLQLSWYYPDRTNGYICELSTDSNFNSGNVHDTVTGMSATFSNIQPSMTYFWRVRQVDSANIGDAWSNRYRFYTSSADGVTLNTEAPYISVQQFPNPASLFATIEYTLPTTLPVHIEVHSILGETMYSRDLPAESAGTHSMALDLRSWANGTYVYRIVAGGASRGGTMQVMK